MKPEYYRRMSKKQLEKELLELKKQLVVSHGAMNQAKMKSEKKKDKAQRGKGNLSKRIRKEIARINTILKENESKS